MPYAVLYPVFTGSPPVPVPSGSSQSILAPGSFSAKSFPCHTYEKCTCNSFRCHTYKNKGLKVLCLPHLQKNARGGRGPEHQQKRIASSSMEHGLRRHVRPQQASVNHFFSCGSRKTENGLRFNYLFSHRNTVDGLSKRSATNLSSLADNGRRRTDRRSAIAPAPVTLLESILTKTASLSPLESILTKKPRGGANRPIEFLL